MFYDLFSDFSLESLPVPLWAFIVSQIFGIVNIGLAVYRYQVKKRDKTINIKIAGNVAKLLNLAFLLNWTLVGLKVVSVIKNITMKKVTGENSKAKRRTSTLLLILFCMIKVGMVFAFWWFNRYWIEWVILGTTLFAMVGKWQKNVHLMRVSSAVNSIAIFINSLFFFLNFTALVKTVFVLGSLVVFYVLHFKKVVRARRVGLLIASDGADDIV